jgi:hypothetical protein
LTKRLENEQIHGGQKLRIADLRPKHGSWTSKSWDKDQGSFGAYKWLWELVSNEGIIEMGNADTPHRGSRKWRSHD